MSVSVVNEQQVLLTAEAYDTQDLTKRLYSQTEYHLLPLLGSSTTSPKAVGHNHSPDSHDAEQSIPPSAEEVVVRKLKAQDTPNSGPNVGSRGLLQEESDYFGPEALWRAALAANWGSHPLKSAGFHHDHCEAIAQGYLQNSELLKEEECLNTRKALAVAENEL
jgi:hypothetical protein